MGTASYRPRGERITREILKHKRDSIYFKFEEAMDEAHARAEEDRQTVVWRTRDGRYVCFDADPPDVSVALH